MTVTAVNDAPVGADTTATTNEDTAITIDVASLISDVDSTTLTVTASSTNGTVSVTGTAITFTPNANYNGPATITYTVTDDAGVPLSDTGTIGVTVTPVNDAPVLTGSAATLVAGTEDVSYTVTAADLLAGFTDVDGGVLSIVGLVSSSGAVIDNGDGTYTITAPVDANGVVSLNYSVSDGAGGLTTATQSFLRVAVDELVASLGDVAGPALLPSSPDRGIAPEERLLQSLDGTLGSVDEHGIVVAAANGVLWLDGLAASEYVENVRQAIAGLDVRGRIGQVLDHASDGHGLVGYSQRVPLLNAETGGGVRSHIVIEAMVRERMLIIEVSDVPLDASKSIVEYRIAQANGRPLPGWLDRAGKGLLVGLRPADIANVELKVTVMFSDGTFEEVAARIDVVSGKIQTLELQRDAFLGRPFSDQFALKDVATEEDISDLAEMLRTSTGKTSETLRLGTSAAGGPH